MKEGNWIPMDKNLVAALPRKRPYTLIEAVFSYQLDMDNSTVRGYREYSRIWGWSVKKVSNFIRNTQATKTEQAKNTQETVRFRFVKPLQDSNKHAGNKQETKREHASNTTNNPNPILNPQSLKKGTMEFCAKQQNSTPISFNEYKERYPLSEEQCLLIDYFMQQYRNHLGKNHPKLKERQWQSVVDTIYCLYDEDTNRDSRDLSADQLREMIDRYFEVQWREGCNNSILHFNSPGVKLRRMYERIY